MTAELGGAIKFASFRFECSTREIELSLVRLCRCERSATPIYVGGKLQLFRSIRAQKTGARAREQNFKVREQCKFLLPAWDGVGAREL